MSPLTIATSNPGKLAEFNRIVGPSITGIELKGLQEPQPDTECNELMTSRQYETAAAKIARGKALFALAQHGSPIIVEDTSLFIDAADGRPGPLIVSFSTPFWLKHWCELAHQAGNPNITAIVSLAMAKNQNDINIWQGVTAGTLPPVPRGKDGIGWDSIFIPNGSNKTFAEMDPAEKDSFSMRARALQALRMNPPD